MVNLDSVIDQCVNRTIQASDALDVTHDDAFVHDILELAPKAVCFDMGDIEGIVGLHDKTELITLPYPVCWFEGTLGQPKRIRGFLCTQIIEDGIKKIISFHLQKRFDEKWMIVCFSEFFYKSEQKYFLGGKGFREDEFGTKSWEYERVAHWWLRVFLSVLNCSNIERVEHKPPRAMRRHPGKGFPPFSWYTLHVSLPNNRIENAMKGSGTHASPRVHLRRGHIRRYRSGKSIWVDWMVVGKKELGMICKDYACDFGSPFNGAAE